MGKSRVKVPDIGLTECVSVCVGGGRIEAKNNAK